MHFNFRRTQGGFTLVELLVVMLVLVALSSITLDFTKDFAFQGRYEVTKDRYDKIKRAIIGRPDVLINGQPDISGFVADMGRLPRNIQELLVQNYCSDDYRISDNTPDNTGLAGTTASDTPAQWCVSETATPVGVWHTASCTDATKTTQTTCQGASETWSSWKGPYLTTKNPDYKPNAFSDGWGNGNETIDLTDHNYGWNYFIVANNLTIQSYGKDGAPNGSDYDADYPNNQPAIRQNDWQIDLNGIPLRILASSVAGTCNTPTPTDPATCAIVGGNWVTPPSCTGETISNVNDCTLLDGSWDSIASTCSGYLIHSEPTCTQVTGSWITPCTGETISNVNDCTLLDGSWASSSCSGHSIYSETACTQVTGSWSPSVTTCDSPVEPLTKLACLSAGETWTSISTDNLCLKIFDPTGISHTSSISRSVTEDGTSQVVYFPYASTSYVTSGESIGILFTDASCTSSNTYDSSHAQNICIDVNDDPDFTSGNCVDNGGIFIDDGTEKFCRNVIGTDCIEDTATTLGGTEHYSISLMLVPHSILPTVTW